MFWLQVKSRSSKSKKKKKKIRKGLQRSNVTSNVSARQERETESKENPVTERRRK
jgi:hypothetical protein